MSIIKQLWQLQEIDTALLDGKKQLGEILHAQKTPAKLVSLREDVASSSQTLKQLESNYAESDDHLQMTTSELEKHITKLYSGNVKNPRELEDLQAKVDSLEKRKQTLDETITTIFGEMETVQTQLDEESKRLEEMEQHWLQKTAQLKQDLQAVALHVNELMGKREIHLPKIDAPSQAQYDRLLKSKRGLAVSVLKQGVCQACRVSVTNNIIRETQLRKITLCTNCGRILFAKH